jgi:hypothetical protein
LHRIILPLIVSFFSLHIYAQQFGGNPASLKWKQVNNDTVRIIFPSGLEQQAQDIAALINEMAEKPVKKINIVLQNQTLLSNGYVALGPYRSEFFMTPRQNNFELGSLPWHKSLALHEYRHVQQYNNYRRGLSKVFYYVFGEEGQAFANSVAVPDWFFEGDAVYQETVLSRQGRGRIPYFFNDYKALWSSHKNYSWMKLRNGSYKDFVPDHYRLGYMLVAYGREKYGDSILKKIASDAAAFKGLFYPMQKAVKKYTGEDYKDFVDNSFMKFRTKSLHDTSSGYANTNRHFAGDEEYPQWINASEIIYVKSSYKKIPSFFKRDIINNKEEKIAVKNISIDNYFSYRNGKIVYSAHKPDLRWGWKNFGEIKIQDINSGEEITVTRKTKYLSPDISDDGKTIVAVNADPSGNNSLHILDAVSGNIINKIPNKEQFVFTQPKFKKDSIVTAARNTKGEMALVLFNRDGGHRLLTPFSMHVIGFPQTAGDTVTFTMSHQGQDKLFCIIDNRTYLFQPEYKNNSTGNYHLSILNNKYAWMMFTAAGFHSITGSGSFTEFEPGKETGTNYGIVNTTGATYRVANYKKSSELLNFHSWRPYITDPEYSYSLIGENILNTFQSELYFTYNRNERFKETGASFAYGGWFPVIRGGASYTFDRSFRDSSQMITWNEFNARFGASVPLSFTHGSFYQNLNFSSSFNSRQVYYTGASKSSFENKQFNFADLSLSFTNQQLKAVQNIYPRFAQSISARHRFILNKYTASQFALSGTLYFPGLFTNHSIVLQGSYQARDTLQQYNFSNIFSMSRGYSDINFPRMWKAGFNYHFPIIYPDYGVANIVYLLRIRGNAFYDYSRIKSLRTGQKHSLRSTGIELYFDSKWWNQLPLSFGIRYSRLLDNELVGLSPNQWEFVLPLTLLSR